MEKRNPCTLLVGKPEGKGLLGRPRCRWLDNIKMVLGEIGWWCGLDWSGSVYGQMKSSCEYYNEPSCSMKCWEAVK
jgi:hypothetical protein